MMKLHRRALQMGLAALMAVGAASMAQAGDVAAAKDVAHVRDSAGKTTAIAVRVAANLLITGKDLAKGEKVSLSVGEPSPLKRHGAGLEGTVVGNDSAHHLSLIEVSPASLDGAALTMVRLAKSAPDFADPLTFHAGGVPELRAVLQAPRRFMLFARQSVQITGDESAAGGALLNDCGELAGFLPASSTTKMQGVQVLRSLITTAKDAVYEAQDNCKVAGKDGLSRIAQAESDRADSARQKVAQLQAQRAAMGEASRDAQGSAAVQKSIDNYNAIAKKSDKLVDTIKAYRGAHKRDMALLVGVPLLLVGLAGAGGFALSRGRKQEQDREKSIAVLRAKSSDVERQLHSEPWRDVVLSGPGGVFKISAAQLSAVGRGVLIGRNGAACDVVFGPDDVSREHCRLFVSGNRLMVEDMGSSGGTSVNSQRLEPRRAVALGNGDRLGLASHDFNVRIG